MVTSLTLRLRGISYVKNKNFWSHPQVASGGTTDFGTLTLGWLFRLGDWGRHVDLTLKWVLYFSHLWVQLSPCYVNYVISQWAWGSTHTSVCLPVFFWPLLEHYTLHVTHCQLYMCPGSRFQKRITGMTTLPSGLQLSVFLSTAECILALRGAVMSTVDLDQTQRVGRKQREEVFKKCGNNLQDKTGSNRTQ